MTIRETPRVKSTRSPQPGARQARGKRRRLLTMCLGVASVGASIAVAAVIAVEFAPTSSRVGEDAASPAQPGAAAIFIHPEGHKCQSRTFDNQTGQITEGSAPCPVTPVDARGVPVPLGTTHTMNSISRSFK